jgi:hypothetical protein
MIESKVISLNALEAYMGSRGKPPLILNLDSRWSWAFNSTHRPLYPRGRDPVPIGKEAGMSPETVRSFWRREKNVFRAGIRTSVSSVRSLVTIRTKLLRMNKINAGILKWKLSIQHNLKKKKVISFAVCARTHVLTECKTNQWKCH